MCGFVCRGLPRSRGDLSWPSQVRSAGQICRREGRKHASASAAAEAWVWANAWERHPAEQTAWNQCGGLDWCILTTQETPDLSQLRSREREACDMAKQGSKKQSQCCRKTAGDWVGNSSEELGSSTGKGQTDRQVLQR